MIQDIPNKKATRFQREIRKDVRVSVPRRQQESAEQQDHWLDFHRQSRDQDSPEQQHLDVSRRGNMTEEGKKAMNNDNL